jgi:MFS family permease
MSEPSTDIAQAPSASGRAAWWSLGVLTLVMLFAVLDRGVLTLQAETIRKSLQLSDFQLGFLQGTAVAIAVGIVSYPLGWLADRYDRRLVLVGCIIFWSLAVVGSGMSQNYWQLLLGSALVGAGEAGLGPITNSLIPDLFKPKQRQMANSIFAVSTTTVSALGLGLTGAVIGAVQAVRPFLPESMVGIHDWRLAFFAVALPAPVMVLLVLTIAVRRRKKVDTAVPVAAATRAVPGSLATMPDLLPYLRQHRQTFTCLFLGLMSVMLGFAAVGGWLAVIYQRVFMQTPQELGARLGAIGLASTAAGFLISVYGMRFFTPRIGPRLNMRVLWLASLWAALAFTTMTFATQAWHLYTIHGVYVTLLTGATMIYPTVIQTVAPSFLRARLFAVIAVLISVCGAAAPPLVGLLSDQFKHLPNGLILAAAMIAVPFLSLGALLLFLCEKPYVKTKEAAELMDANAAPIDSLSAEPSRA